MRQACTLFLRWRHGPPSPFKWNQYGFTLDGPVRIPKVFNGRDKLFFMGNYEAYRKRGSTTALFSLASAPMLAT